MNGKPRLKTQLKHYFIEPSTCASGWQAPPIQPLNKIKARLANDLATRWGVSTRLHYTRPIEALLSGARDERGVRWRYEADSLEPQEYLRRFYHRRECRDKVLQLCEYFKYHYEIPRIFLPGLIDIIDSFHDRKRNQIYNKVKQLIGKENIVGDETPSDAIGSQPIHAPPCYSILLRGLKPQKGGPLPMPPQEDTVALLAKQLDKLRLSTVSGEVSTLSLAQQTPHTSVCFTIDEDAIYATSPKEKIVFNPSMVLKKQKKPTIVQLQLESLKDYPKQIRLPTKTLVPSSPVPQSILALDKKKSPRATITQKTRAKQLPKEPTSTTTQHLLPGFDANTLIRFRKELEEFQLAQSQSGRKKPLFASVKDPLILAARKSLSPKPLYSSGKMIRDSMRLDSFKVLRTEPSVSVFTGMAHSLRPKENRSQDKLLSTKATLSSSKPPHSHKLSQQLTSVRSAGQSNEKQTKAHLGYIRTEKSREVARVFGTKNRKVSPSTLGQTNSPRDFVHMKRLKSEEQEKTEPTIRFFDRKNTVGTKINVISKPAASQGLTKPSKAKEVTASKKLSHGAQLTSFRSRPKLGSINFN